MLTRCVLCSFLLVCCPLLRAQSGVSTEGWTLAECLDYAMAHQPALLAAREELRVTTLDNRIALSAWLPEFALSGNAQHYFKRPVSIFPDFQDPDSGATTEVEIGTINNSTLTATARQTLYNPTVASATRRQAPLLEVARLNIEAEEIDLRDELTRAYYQATRAREQLVLLRADLTRQERALRDAKLLFDNGLNDKVDYKRATITLNRTRVDLQNAIIEQQTSIVALKQLMGYPEATPLELVYDLDVLAATVFGDSLPLLQPTRRIELRQLAVQDRLLALDGLFYRRAWLPDVYLGGTYNMNWQNNELTALYDRVFPNALASLNVSVPLFSGGRRFRQIERQSVLRSQLSYDVLAQRDRINREYREAYGTYDQARNTYLMARENVALAEEIYGVVDLQYREGIAPFLEVVIAENDLQEARLATVNSLIDAALARVSVQLAAGTL